MGGRGLLFLTSAELPRHQPLPHPCAAMQSEEFSHSLPTSPSHQLIPPLQPPSHSPQPLTAAPPGSSQPHTLLWGVCSILLCSLLPSMGAKTSKISNPLHWNCYMLLNQSISLTPAGSKGEARGGAGGQGSSSLSPCCGKGSFSPKPNDWTRFGCSASTAEQTRFDLPPSARKDICPQPANPGTHRGHPPQDISMSLA